MPFGLNTYKGDDYGQIRDEVVVEADIVHAPEFLDESHRLEAVSALSWILVDDHVLRLDQGPLLPVERIPVLLTGAVVDLAHVSLVGELQLLPNNFLHFAFKQGRRVHIIESNDDSKCYKFPDDINNTLQ